MKKSITFCFLILALLQLKGQSNEVLLCPPNGKISIFNEHTLESGKFKKDDVLMSPKAPIYAPIVICDTILFNKGKDIAHLITINGEKGVLYYPYKMTEKFSDYGYSAFAKYENDNNGSSYKNRSSGKRISSPQYSWYRYEDYAHLSDLKDSILYYNSSNPLAGKQFDRGQVFKINSFGFGSRPDFQSGEYRLELELGYKDFRDSYYSLTLYLYPDSNNGSRNHKSTYTIQELLNVLIPENQYKDLCKNRYDKNMIDSISNLYLGKEIFWDYLPQYPVRQKERDYWILEDIHIGKVTNPDDGLVFAYFGTLKSTENKGTSYMYIPLKGRDDIELADDHRAKLEVERKLKEERKLKRKKEEEKWYQERKTELTKKYGKAKASLIIEGYVEIGMTKEMCIDAWGYPLDSSSIIKQTGNGEMWIYDGSILYFEGNKLTMIQD